MPTFNDVCKDTVEVLQRQAEKIDGLSYEIIVADDGSTDDDAKLKNQAINLLPHCRYIEREENVGRAAIRNFLASVAAYDWLLFLDSGMSIADDDFLLRYLQSDADVVCGGYQVIEPKVIDRSSAVTRSVVHESAREITFERDAVALNHLNRDAVALNPLSNLRYRYEKAAEEKLSKESRSAAPYQNFHTSNFLMARSIYLAHPLDTRFRRYGYEDVLMGKQLQEAGIAIEHIDNPVLFDRFDSNERFVEKTEEALQTLHDFREELTGYSRMLDVAGKLKKWGLVRPYLFIYNRMKENWRSNLCGRAPSLLQFKLYKVGYYLSL
ncbi:MAG: glycosyltransferase family 2 protein [Prevotella sp.]|nr:glycosyltransferase family 2 protein [Prevotella sp.]